MRITTRDTILHTILASAFAVVFLSCSVEPLTVIPDGEVKITATASLPQCRTKMIYEDAYPGSGGIKAGWKTGDTFLALEINGSTATPVTFRATASADVKTSFTSEGAVAADASTRWVAVLGKAASFSEGLINCSYSGQNGSLKGLEGYDYMVAEASGVTPDFDYSKGRHLTYLLRIVMPEGVGTLEFNTCASGAEWAVSSDGSTVPCMPDFRPRAVKTLALPDETKEGDIVYLAIPAIDYTETGLIVTAMNNAGTKAQGKVKSDDFSIKGGRVGTFEIDNLIDRPTTDAAIDFGTPSKSILQYINNNSWEGVSDIYRFSTSPRWAPFNIGASASPISAEEYYGEFFAWGETSQRHSYTAETYKYIGKDDSIGYSKTIYGDADIPLTLQTISGTKYDVARVKWGSAWRMPYLEEMLGLIGGAGTLTPSDGKEYETDSGYITVNVSEYKGVAVDGRIFSRNGKTLFFPFAGRYYYTASEAATTPSLVGKAGLYFCGTHNTSDTSPSAYRMYVRGNHIEISAEETGKGFSVRPVLAESTDHPDAITASGYVKDAVSGRGIAGVTVSDGFNCTTTDSEGLYKMQIDANARTINVSVPALYEIPLSDDGRPAFFKYIDLSTDTSPTADFSLTRRQRHSSKFTIITIADAHVQNSSQLKQFNEGPVADIQHTIDKLDSSDDFGTIIGIALGDQLTDNFDMVPSIRNSYTGFHTKNGIMPLFYVIGNHDHESISGGTDFESTDNFFRNFGPTDYSFDIGDAHIIVVDDIEYTGEYEAGSGGTNKIKYKERITGKKLHWLKQDITNVSDKSNKMVVLCTHAPLYNPVGNVDAVKSLLGSFREAHILSGHIHNLSNTIHRNTTTVGGGAITEHNIQSLSGLWWLADLSPNGTPAGYGVYTFDGSTMVSEYNKVWKESEDFQIRVYNGNDHWYDYSWDSQYKGKFLARVWDGDDNWSLDFVYNGESSPMTRLTDALIDKCAASYIVNILHSPHGTNGKASSYSWWMIDAPGGEPANVHGWKIVARHHLPGGMDKEYNASIISNDFTGFELGSNYIWLQPDQDPEPDTGSISPTLSEDDNSTEFNKY